MYIDSRISVGDQWNVIDYLKFKCERIIFVSLVYNRRSIDIDDL